MKCKGIRNNSSVFFGGLVLGFSIQLCYNTRDHEAYKWRYTAALETQGAPAQAIRDKYFIFPEFLDRDGWIFSTSGFQMRIETELDMGRMWTVCKGNL